MTMSNMTTDEIFKFLELYRAENCLWDPKNELHKNKKAIIASWKRIADTMGIPVHELKRKKECLLATFRINVKKRLASIRSGAKGEDVYQPIWIFYDAMAAFLGDVYESTSFVNSEENTQPDLYEEANSNASDSFLIAVNEDSDYNYTDIAATPEKRTITQTLKRRAKDPLKLQETSRRMNSSFSAFNNSVINEQSVKEDESDLFCKMLAKKIKEYPKSEREEIMYELHGVMINRRRQYNKF